jgi:hypothetical protein
MALKPAWAVPINMKADGVLTAVDDYFKITMPFDGYLMQVDANLGTVGTGSGNTDFVVENETDGDLWTVATGVGRLPFGTVTQTFYVGSITYPNIAAGEVLTLNVNAIDGGGVNADLMVTLWVVPQWA